MTDKARKIFDSQMAGQIIGFLMDTATSANLGIAAAVSDANGELMAFARTDSCPPVSINVAIAKVYTAARLRKSTRELYDEGFELANLADSGYTMYPGGFPVIIDGECLGAVGVSGLAPEDDEALVREAIGRVIK